MNELAIRDRLVEHGKILLDAPIEPTRFTGIAAADVLLNDLKRYPHAFVLACAMDRQIQAERAWAIPHLIAKKIGGFSMKRLTNLSRGEVNKLMSKPENLHRFPDKMAGIFYSAIQRIAKEYGGNASRIWADKPSSAEAVYRFLEFDGVGPKIATMAVNILARRFKISFADYYSVDISADSHVRRVFGRLGLCVPDAEIGQIIYKARALYPKFPGIMDPASWEIGRRWCGTRTRKCDECYMNDLCPSAKMEH
jgi:endonuclease-3